MHRIENFAVKICRTFLRAEIEWIVAVLTAVLSRRRRDAAIHDDLRQKQPHHHQFPVPPSSTKYAQYPLDALQVLGQSERKLHACIYPSAHLFLVIVLWVT